MLIAQPPPGRGSMLMLMLMLMLMIMLMLMLMLMSKLNSITHKQIYNFTVTVTQFVPREMKCANVAYIPYRYAYYIYIYICICVV